MELYTVKAAFKLNTPFIKFNRLVLIIVDVFVYIYSLMCARTFKAGATSVSKCYLEKHHKKLHLIQK